MENKDAIEELKGLQEFINGTRLKGEIRAEALDLAIKALESSSWIPVKTRELSAEEIEELIEKNEHMYSADEIEKWCYCCSLPEDDQDVLITAKLGYVTMVTFYADDVYGCYFEGYEDRDDVLAWMPLPKRYTKEDDDT